GPRRGTRPSPGSSCGNRRTTSTTARPGCRMTSRCSWKTWSGRAGARRRWSCSWWRRLRPARETSRPCVVSRSGRPWRRRPGPWRTRPSSWAPATSFPLACWPVSPSRPWCSTAAPARRGWVARERPSRAQYRGPYTGYLRGSRTTWRPRPSSPSCWSSSSRPDRRDLPGQPDAEAGGSQLQQHLAGGLQVGDLSRAQLLELRQPRGVDVRSLPPGAVQRDGIGPYFDARLAQEPLGAEPVEGLEQPVEQGRGTGEPGQLVVLGADPGGEHAVDRLVVGLPAGQQRRVAELLVGDHRQQRLRQVVVDVGVHAEQHVPERGQAGGGAERDVPGPRRPLARQRGFQGVQVETGERDIPPLHPLGIVETA